MSERHSSLVTVSGKKSGEKKSKSSGKRKLKHMVIRPVENGGFVTEKHYEPQNENQMYGNNPPEEHAHEDRDDMMDHVESTFPDGASEDGSQSEADQAGETNE